MGSGLGKAGGVVHWRVVRNMVIAWILTLPAAGLMGALGHEGVQVFPNDTAGVFAVGLAGLAVACSLFVLARRTRPRDGRQCRRRADHPPVGLATPIGVPA